MNRDKKYRAVIFDLDGTLLDTLEDLTDAVNHTMRKFNCPEHTLTQVRSFVGNGIKVLIERCLKDGINTPQFNDIFNEFQQYYTAHCRIKTHPYTGIIELLEKLYADGYKLAIVSNKNQAAVTELNSIYFSKYITTAIGNSENIRKKPAPDTTLKAMEDMNCTREECVYIGDSEVDIETAKNSGLDCISVSWGFRDKALLQKLNPDAVIDSPSELYLKLYAPDVCTPLKTLS